MMQHIISREEAQKIFDSIPSEERVNCVVCPDGTVARASHTEVVRATQEMCDEENRLINETGDDR